MNKAREALTRAVTFPTTRTEEALVSITQTLLRLDLAPGQTPNPVHIRYTVELVAKNLLRVESATLEDNAVAELCRRMGVPDRVQS